LRLAVEAGLARVPVAEQLDLTIVYEPGENGWVLASIPEVQASSARAGRVRTRAPT
jgi:hypothetical protein